jgi:mannose-6-phosphate isomerase-like protein (cupin superfamily)
MASWQLLLSPRPTRRTNISSEPVVFGVNGTIQYEFLREDGRDVVRETHYMSKDTVRKGLSGPPLHIHLRQAEFFHVQQGVLGVHKNGKVHAITANDGPVEIPAGERHRFWAHPSGTEDLIFKVWVDPEDLDKGFDETFMRNFTGYLRDCERDKIAPSIFQILLFIHHSDMVLTPPFWLPIWFLVGLHHVFAYWVGAGLLGYKTSYPEYGQYDILDSASKKGK